MMLRLNSTSPQKYVLEKTKLDPTDIENQRMSTKVYIVEAVRSL